MSGTPTFDEWAVLELMGHRKLAGKVSEATIGGGAFIRIDVPGVEKEWEATQFYAPGAVYCISPVSEDIARRFAANTRPAPVTRYELAATVESPLAREEQRLREAGYSDSEISGHDDDAGFDEDEDEDNSGERTSEPRGEPT